ncbi:hypothetical protein AWV79_16470 [Cupriavidus sp. UYMMa02A]|nr:hypothetical protein AWV79_16470 [Cupriavidus sp. UYMMa02A]
MTHDSEAAPPRQNGHSAPALIPVAIIGAGTAGSVLALLLASRGIRSVLVERQRDADTHPRGHVWSARAMEVIRAIDVELAEQLREISSPPLKLRYITWCTSLAGVDLGRCVPIGNDPAHTASLLGSGPCRPLHLSQNVTDPILRERVARNALIEFLPGYELESLSQDRHACTLTLRELRSGLSVRRTARSWRARWRAEHGSAPGGRAICPDAAAGGGANPFSRAVGQADHSAAKPLVLDFQSQGGGHAHRPHRR